MFLLLMLLVYPYIGSEAEDFGEFLYTNVNV